MTVQKPEPGRRVKAIACAALAAAALLASAANQAEAAILQCVQYARSITNVPIKGDAWTWWNKAAAARIGRGAEPELGAVLVFRKTGRLPRGHVAVVSEVINNREIMVDHANWASRRGERGRVDLAVRVLDVSPANDWSEVRVWYAPADTFGQRVYPAYGFIYAFDGLSYGS